MYVHVANHILLVGSSGQARPTKQVRVMAKEITFSEEDARDVHWLHNDTLIICAQISNVEV